MNKKLIINPENLKGTLVDMTPEEISQKEQDEANAIIVANAETDKETKKASGKQKLKDLGLDDAEIKALIGV
tara:strand:+ start:146 stop:361 length:216 start_codon:yes stop_codon:yes gene_type:complete